ncbi:MAG: NAD(P)H-hydrate epimerase, partial [Trueperaceae bacterium]
MKLYSAAQMQGADARAAAAGVPTAQLMAAAGRGVAHALLEAYPSVSSVVVLCGAGNNGGDGYVAASDLSAR